MTDINGNVTVTYDYDAFGLEIATTGTTSNEYKYCGEQWDPNVGFYFLRARYYMPQQGRFLNMDTWAGSSYDPISLHKYLYANADPMNRIDPSGNKNMTEVSIMSAIQGNLEKLSAFRIYSAWRTFEKYKNKVDLAYAAAHSIYALLSPDITFNPASAASSLKFETKGIYRDTRACCITPSETSSIQRRSKSIAIDWIKWYNSPTRKSARRRKYNGLQLHRM